MSLFNEKRSGERHRHESPIIVAKFVSESEVSHEGKSHNYSEGGIYFETNSPFTPGTVVHIRREKCSTGKHTLTLNMYDGFRSVTLAEIKWCRKMSYQNDSRYHYCMGARYFRTD